MGRSLGRGMREFKDSISGKDDDEPIHKRYSTELPPAESADQAPEYVDVEPPERDRVTRERDTIT